MQTTCHRCWNKQNWPVFLIKFIIQQISIQKWVNKCPTPKMHSDFFWFLTWRKLENGRKQRSVYVHANTLKVLFVHMPTPTFVKLNEFCHFISMHNDELSYFQFTFLKRLRERASEGKSNYLMRVCARITKKDGEKCQVN